MTLSPSVRVESGKWDIVSKAEERKGHCVLRVFVSQG